MARRRRRERLVGIVVAGLGVAVLIVAIIALRNPHTDGVHAGQPTTTPSSSHGSTSSHPSPTTSSSRPTTSVSNSPSTPATDTKLPLVVLNNTTVQQLAQQAKARFEAGGWTVTSVGNLTNDIVSTCAYYDPAMPGSRAAVLTLQLQYPTIKRVEPKFAGLPAGPIVVVLTPDYSTN
ncbi:MAG: LytR C-terminal domain-containing protein [Jatrophihabitantaceae bacterium]